MFRGVWVCTLCALLLSAVPCAAEPLAQYSDADSEVRLQQEGAAIWLEVSVLGKSGEQWDGAPLISVIRVRTPHCLIVDVPLVASENSNPDESQLTELQHPLFSSFQVKTYRNMLRLELGLRSESALRYAQNYLREHQTVKLHFQDTLILSPGNGQPVFTRQGVGLPSYDRAKSLPPPEIAANVMKNSARSIPARADLPNANHWNTAEQYLEKTAVKRRDINFAVSGEAINLNDYRGYGGLEETVEIEKFKPEDDEGIDLNRRESWSEQRYSSVRHFVRTNPAVIAMLATMIGLLTVIAGIIFWRARSVMARNRSRARKARSTASFAESWYGADQLQAAQEELRQCYEVLGVDAKSSDEAVKSRYKHLVKVFHADKLESRELPDEVMRLATEQFQRIQAAYETVKQQRNIS